MQQSAAPITHGSRMDHFYAVDAVNGLTYVGHCEQTSTVQGLLNLIHCGVMPTMAIFQKMKEKNQDYGTTVTEFYLHAHTKGATLSITPEGRVAIHNLDAVLRAVEKAMNGGSHAPAVAPAPAPKPAATPGLGPSPIISSSATPPSAPAAVPAGSPPMPTASALPRPS